MKEDDVNDGEHCIRVCNYDFKRTLDNHYYATAYSSCGIKGLIFVGFGEYKQSLSEALFESHSSIRVGLIGLHDFGCLNDFYYKYIHDEKGKICGNYQACGECNKRMLHFVKNKKGLLTQL